VFSRRQRPQPSSCHVARRFHVYHDLVRHTRGLLELRGRRARAQGADSHTVTLHLLGQPLCEQQVEGLTCSVCCHVGHGLVGGCRRNDQDVTRAAFNHASKVEAREVNHGGAVHLHDSEFALHIAMAELTVGADAGIVYQQVDSYAPFFGERKNLFRPFWLAKICGEHLNLDVMRRAQFSAQFCKPLFPSGREHKMRAPRRKFLRECPADAGTRAAHQSPFSAPGIEVRHSCVT